MKAMILAAGVGSRLGAITQRIPKCLVEVGGKTLLAHVITHLKSLGVRYIVINTHHFAEQVVSYLKDQDNFGIEIHLSPEKSLLDTGGGLYHARSHFIQDSEPFIVHNADVYHELDLNRLLTEHRLHSPIATLLVMKRETRRLLLFDNRLTLVGRQSADAAPEVVRQCSHQERLAFSGIQLVHPQIFEDFQILSPRFSLIDGYLQAVRAGKSVRGLVLEGAWNDIGTPERLAAVRQKVALSKR